MRRLCGLRTTRRSIAFATISPGIKDPSSPYNWPRSLIMSDVPEIEAGRGLWRRLPRQPVQTGDMIGAVDLAAWVDGKLDERASARIEAALLANPQLLETPIAPRAALIDAADDAARLVVRAQALVPAPLRVPQS